MITKLANESTRDVQRAGNAMGETNILKVLTGLFDSSEAVVRSSFVISRAPNQE